MRRKALQAAAGAAALISALYSNVFCCKAFVVRTEVPRRGDVRRARGGVAGLRAAWIDEQVSLEMPASSQDAYSVYSDLRRQPEWSPWLKTVEHDRESGTSKWVIQSKGFRVSWRAQNTAEVFGSEVAWESMTGLSNRGRVVFEDRGEDRCLMTLTLSYNLPYVIASVLRLEVVERFVKRTILSDLARFKKVLVREIEKATAPAPAAGPGPAPAVAVESGSPSFSGPPSSKEAGDTTAAPAVAVEYESSSASSSPSHREGDSAVTAGGAPATAVTATGAAAGAAGGAPLEASTGNNHAVEVREGAGVELEGEDVASHAPGGRRRSRWRRRFRRLLRLGGREQDVAIAVAVGAENDASRAGVGEAAKL